MACGIYGPRGAAPCHAINVPGSLAFPLPSPFPLRALPNHIIPNWIVVRGGIILGRRDGFQVFQVFAFGSHCSFSS